MVSVLIKRLLVVGLFFSVISYGLAAVTLSLVGRHAGHLVGLVVGGYERFTRLHAETTLAHFASFQEVQRLDPKACELFRPDLASNDGFFAVLALGQADGQTICTADPRVKLPFPTMADRLYYQRAKEESGLVVGEYAVSRTTGIPTLHFAYPIRNEHNQFQGLLMAAVDLGWFVDPAVNQYFQHEDVQILAVDYAGKLLYSYPALGTAMTGADVVTTEEASVILSGKEPYRFMKGFDGRYRIYSYKTIEGGENDQILFLVGISLWQFRYTILMASLLGLGSIAFIWTLCSKGIKRKK